MTQLAFRVKPARSKHIKDSKDRLFLLTVKSFFIFFFFFFFFFQDQCLIITDIYDVREKEYPAGWKCNT